MRGQLIENKIYIAKYWMDVIERANETEKQMIQQVVFLPVDQRVEFSDLLNIKKVISENG